MLSIIVPTFNEKESIQNFINTLSKCLKGFDFELIIIDDSTDGTAAIAKKLCSAMQLKYNVFHRKAKSGKGGAVKEGLTLAKGDTIVIIDADLEYHPRFIPLMVKRLKDCDLVTAIRIRRDALHRRILGSLFRFVVLILFGIPFETQSGLKVMKKSAIESVQLKSNGWVWDVELIKKVMNKNCKICTHIIPYETRELGKSKISFFTPFQMLKDLILLRLSL